MAERTKSPYVPSGRRTYQVVVRTKWPYVPSGRTYQVAVHTNYGTKRRSGKCQHHLGSIGFYFDVSPNKMLRQIIIVAVLLHGKSRHDRWRHILAVSRHFLSKPNIMTYLYVITYCVKIGSKLRPNERLTLKYKKNK